MVSWRAAPPLTEGRFGHAAALLEDGRLLVTGGFRRNGETLETLSSAEVLSFATPPGPINACVDPISPTLFDAGPPPMDAGGAAVEGGAVALDGAIVPRPADAG